MQRREPLTLKGPLARLYRRRDERGSVIVFTTIMLIMLIAFAALIVDVGNSRQQKREAQVAADSGALAGAYAITTQSIAACGNDVDCTAAYYTFQSLGVHVGSSPSWSISSCGASCTAYAIGGQSVEVTHPYPFNGNDGSSDVNVKACWTKPNFFGKMLGISTTQVCGHATGERFGGTSISGGGSTDRPIDCSGEDNFADASDKPQIIPATGTTVKAGTTIGAHFHGFDSNLDVTSIDFKAPDAAGNLVTLGYDPTAKNGYKLNPAPPLDANGDPLPYDQLKGAKVDITYILPKAPPLPKTDATGARIVYTASLFAKDMDQDNAPDPDCGNVQWKFTWDGQGLNSGSCGENSFVYSVYPSGGIAAPGDHIGAVYTDESPLQSDPWSPLFKFGVKFTLSGPGWTDDTGNPTQLDYQLLPASGPDKYNTKIDFQLPDASQFMAGVNYTAELSAYDTDQNKPGNDCGHAVWTFQVPGGTAGDIHLVE